MLIEDEQGNQLLELIRLDDADPILHKLRRSA